MSGSRGARPNDARTAVAAWSGRTLQRNPERRAALHRQLAALLARAVPAVQRDARRAGLRLSAATATTARHGTHVAGTVGGTTFWVGKTCAPRREGLDCGLGSTRAHRRRRLGAATTSRLPSPTSFGGPALDGVNPRGEPSPRRIRASRGNATNALPLLAANVSTAFTTAPSLVRRRAVWSNVGACVALRSGDGILSPRSPPAGEQRDALDGRAARHRGGGAPQERFPTYRPLDQSCSRRTRRRRYHHTAPARPIACSQGHT